MLGNYWDEILLGIFQMHGEHLANGTMALLFFLKLLSYSNFGFQSYLEYRLNVEAQNRQGIG